MPKFLWAGIVVFLDQWTKSLVCKKLFIQESIPVIKGIFHLTLVYNTGSVFGLFKGHTGVFICVSISVIIFILFLFYKKEGLFPWQKFWWDFSLALILGGACGNLIDRIRFKYVIDFLDFRIWPVFNLADSAITIGTIILGIILFRKERRHYIKA